MSIERVSLDQQTAERFDDPMEILGLHELTVTCPGGARDVLIHQGSTEIIATRDKKLPNALASNFHPGGLDVTDHLVIGNASRVDSLETFA